MAVPALEVSFLASSGQTLVRGFPRFSGSQAGVEARLVVGPNCLGTLGGADQGKSAPLAHSLRRSCRAQYLGHGQRLAAERSAISHSCATNRRQRDRGSFSQTSEPI